MPDDEKGDGAERAPEGRRLASRYRLEPFDPADAGRSEQLVAMWTEGGALAEGTARERLNEAIFVAVDEEDGVVGVSTARLENVTHLGMLMWIYRTFVAEGHREGDIAFLLLHRSRDELLERYTSGRDTQGAGMLMEVQNPILRKARNQGVWKTTRFAFIGEDEVGAHHRVFYFPGAHAYRLGVGGSGR
jgi:hypothetical protein